MAEPVRARRLADEEGRRLQQVVRRGKYGSVRVRRAMIIMAIARLTAADEDTVRDVIHAFNHKGLAALDPRWAVEDLVMGGSDHPNHIVLARRLQDYLRRRNANARHPDILAV